eukprot:snap_masked-scaffold_1-processed-gene-26.19-mRNA-1 protein AED:1.00 eAED:1.00 QI:0/-1/0/0/-1/1/1/0/345
MIGTKTLFYGILYFLSSSTMLLFNKLVVTYLPIPGLVTMIQYAFSILCVGLLYLVGIIPIQKLSKKETLRFAPVPILFACAVFANNKILQFANIETFIVIRNTTPLFVAAIEFLVLGKSLPNLRSFLSFLLIIFGAVFYASVESGIDLRSYFWGSFYLFTLCTESVFVKHVFNSIDMTVWERMLYTNGISFLIQPSFIFLTDEYLGYTNGSLSVTPSAIGFLILSCLGGFSISFAGTGFRNEVSATTFTFFGVLNKLITLSVNYVMWDQHASLEGIGALLVCLMGSIAYRPSTRREKGSFSQKLWNIMNSLFCNICSSLQLTRDHRPQYEPAPTKEDDPEEESLA